MKSSSWVGYGSTTTPGGAGPLQLTAGTWQHVAIVCDGKDIVIYLDGKESARGAGSNPLSTNPQLALQLGNGYAEGRYFAGALDEFCIYGRALSAEEIKELAK